MLESEFRKKNCEVNMSFIVWIYGILWFQRNLVWPRFWVNYRTKHSHYTRYYCHWNLRLKSYWTRSASLRPMEVYPNRARPARIRSRRRRPTIVWQGTYFFTLLVKLIARNNFMAYLAIGNGSWYILIAVCVSTQQIFLSNRNRDFFSLIQSLKFDEWRCLTKSSRTWICT